ncbi:MAG: hypothetical protein ACJ8CN_12705, partial [Gemmatimonadales bacterium]
DLLYTVDGRSVEIIEIATGKMRHTVEVKGGVLMGSHQVDHPLYVSREYAGGLVIIDLKEGKLEFPTKSGHPDKVVYSP